MLEMYLTHVPYTQEEWVSRIHGIERLSDALKDPEVLQTVVPGMRSLLHCLLITMAEDRNYRVATSSIGAVRGLIASLPHAVLQDHLPQIVAGLTRHIGGAGSVNLKIETVQVAKELMRIMKPNPVVEVLFTSECIGAKSSKVRHCRVAINSSKSHLVTKKCRKPISVVARPKA
jgi:hypothetical protein